MTGEQPDTIHFDILGKTILGIVCHRYHVLNDIVLIYDIKSNCKVIKMASALDEGPVEEHKIEGHVVVDVKAAENLKMFLFTTKDKQFLVNDRNQIVESSDEWSDSYFDELANDFYRMDTYGHWYDIEGLRMREKVFLRDDVLTSLTSKISKQSLSFKNQEVFISKHKQLIQIGKVVFDINLNIVKYFGEKITGLGSANISFDGQDVLQEVKLGINDFAFINEFSHEPFLFENNKITKHLATRRYGQKRVVIFQAGEKSYGVEGSSDNFLTHQNKPLRIEGEDYIPFKDYELIKVNNGELNFYYDLSEREPLELPGLINKTISNIDTDYIRVYNSKVFNVSTSNEEFCIYEEDSRVFKLNDNSVKPQCIENVKGFEEFFGFAWIDGKRKLFSKKHSRILRFGKDGLEVSEFKNSVLDKFINALDTNGNKLVLDLRLGIDQVSMAQVGDDTLSEVSDNYLPTGNKILLNVLVENLGGLTKRVININSESLTYFTLPINLKQVSDQEVQSVFAGCFISEIFIDKETVVEGKIFVSANFESISGKIMPVILDKSTGLPLHLDGVGHRNELASKWVSYTLEKPLFLGENRMVGVYTIKEDQKESKLLFSVQQLTSWLPFFDKYLPIFKQVVGIELGIKEESWDYHLFELREVSNEKEYIAVEKVEPYRILADKRGSEYSPRIVKSKKKTIKSPEELTTLQRFFYAESGYLVEVE